MTQDDPRKLLTTRAAAHYISMSESFLRQARVDKDKTENAPPYIKIGRAVRYRLSDIDEWLSRQTQS